jgi:hypothetical protein
MSASPGLGHNQPPPDPIGRASELVATANRWIAERPEIVDGEMAGVAQDFLKQLRANRDDLEASMKAERKPLDDAVAAIRVKYRDPLELVGIALTKMREKLAPWLTREQDRLDAEAAERERLAADAAAHADAARKTAQQTGTVEAELEAQRAAQQLEDAQRAAAKPVGRARVRGDLSDRASSMRVTHYAAVVDEDKALRSYAKDATVRAAALIAATRLASALAKEVRGDPKRCPAGFEFRRKETPT